jgi:hypothetical protein
MKQYSITCKDGVDVDLPTGSATLAQARTIAQALAEERGDICLLCVRNGAGKLQLASGNALFQPERMDRLPVVLTKAEATILAKARGLSAKNAAKNAATPENRLCPHPQCGCPIDIHHDLGGCPNCECSKSIAGIEEQEGK